jgi:hypothetical protein
MPIVSIDIHFGTKCLPLTSEILIPFATLAAHDQTNHEEDERGEEESVQEA